MFDASTSDHEVVDKSGTFLLHRYLDRAEMVSQDVSMKGKPLDLTGRRFGLYIALRKDSQGTHPKWECRCDCGNVRLVFATNLLSGSSTSCGCSKDQHGRSKTMLYRAWKGMRERCEQASHPKYPRYGGRGIVVCERWKDFRNFLADMGERPEGMTLGRVDNDGPYSPANCRWETAGQQQNNRSDNRFITWNERTMTLSQWAVTLGLKRELIKDRLDRGWSVERAFGLTCAPAGSNGA